MIIDITQHQLVILKSVVEGTLRKAITLGDSELAADLTEIKAAIGKAEK